MPRLTRCGSARTRAWSSRPRGETPGGAAAAAAGGGGSLCRDFGRTPGRTPMGAPVLFSNMDKAASSRRPPVKHKKRCPFAHQRSFAAQIGPTPVGAASTACRRQRDPRGATTASNHRQSVTTRAKDPRGGWLRATRRGQQASRRSLLRRASTPTRHQIGWASGGDAIPHCRHRRLGAFARRWRRMTHQHTPPANHRCASQCVSRRSATSASYRRLQWQRQSRSHLRRRRRRRRPR